MDVGGFVDDDIGAHGGGGMAAAGGRFVEQERFDLTVFVQEARENLVSPKTLKLQVDIVVRPYANEYGDDPGYNIAPKSECGRRLFGLPIHRIATCCRPSLAAHSRSPTVNVVFGVFSWPAGQQMDAVEAQDPFVSASDGEHRKHRQERQRFRRGKFGGKSGGWDFRVTRNNCNRSLNMYEKALRQSFEARKLLSTHIDRAVESASKEWDLVQVRTCLRE